MDRRALMASLGALTLTPQLAWAKEYIDLDWTDLVPKDQAFVPTELEALINHDKAPLTSQQPRSTGVRDDWNGEVVRLPGFVVPLEYSGTGVTAFILVPYAGACVHVPPPPPNQLVFVTTNDPYESSGLYEPVNVIGMFGTAAMSTHIADIAYALSADQIEPFRL